MDLEKWQEIYEFLNSCVQGVENITQEDHSISKPVSPQLKPTQFDQPKCLITKKVFIVHGRNQGYQEAVARLIEKLKLEPIILHEQANEGKTIIEKFESHANVAYAVIILTGDDKGGLSSMVHSEQKLRARQNVIMELGFFMGRLGRDRVCCLYQEGVELPSDYLGILFVELDEKEGWKLKLVKEFNAAGLPIDIRNII